MKIMDKFKLLNKVIKIKSMASISLNRVMKKRFSPIKRFIPRIDKLSRKQMNQKIMQRIMTLNQIHKII